MRTVHEFDLDLFDQRLLTLAKQAANMSIDPDRKVGAAVVSKVINHSPIFIGYNRLPLGISRTPEEWADGDAKREIILHAENVALLDVQPMPTGTYSLYLWGASICGQCAALAIEKGVSEIFYSYHELGARWLRSTEHAHRMLEERKINIVRVL